MNEQESSSSMEKKCPQCGAPLPSGGLAGLCPACLLAQAANETAVPPGIGGFVPPTVEELKALFPQLEIISLIGKGGMGAVYQARQPGLDRIVALKILPSRTDTGADFAERFNREARALARLNHPNIVTVHEFGQVNGMPFFLMEYVDGLNLRQLEQAGKLSPREALQIVPQICEALQFAHDAGIVHRDIKPDNILLDKKGRVKIADFGIAKIMGSPAETGVPETQGAIGTPNYMAPEQIEKPQTVDHRADIFSLGVVFYEMLTGELPLGKFAPPSSGPRGLRVDVRLDEVVLRALEKEPDRRYQHASQVKTAVETIAGTPPGAPPLPPPPPPPFPPAPAPVPQPDDFSGRDYALDISSCVNRGWELITRHFWELIAIHFLIWIIATIIDSTLGRIGSFTNGFSGGGFYGVATLLEAAVSGPLWAGLFLYFLKTMRGESATVETAFSGFTKCFVQVFLVGLVSWLLISAGFFFCIIPGIYLGVAWVFSLVLVADKGMDFWPAMELSRRMVSKHWWTVLAFLIVVAAIWLLGLLACCIGVLVSAPVAMAIFLYAYEDIFGGVPKGASQLGATGPTGTVVYPSTPVQANVTGRAGSPVKYFLLAVAGILLLLVLGGLLLSGGMVVHHGAGMLGGRQLLLALIGVLTVLVMAGIGFIGFKILNGDASSANDRRGFLKYAVLAAIGVVAMLVVAGVLLRLMVIHKSNFNWTYSYSASAHPPVFKPWMPTPSAPPWPPAFPQISTSQVRNQKAEDSLATYNTLVDRVRQELGTSVRFKKLHLSSTNDSTLLISFADLREIRLVAGTNAWRPISGSLLGTRTEENRWVFEGQDALSVVRFDIADMDLPQVLAGASSAATSAAGDDQSAAGYSHENTLERLEIAKNIMGMTVRDQALAGLAKEAAAAEDIAVARSALEAMSQMDDQGHASHDVAIMLAKSGHRREAIEIAEAIMSMDIHDKTLAELAQ